jgi:AcrR family transcriptional regulator
MEDVSTPYEVNGRSGQKARTRAALVDAARVLIGRGVTPTVAQAAEAAGLSRAAAYRYFPDRRSLLVAAHPETGATTMLGPDPSGDPSQRLDEVVQRFTRMIVDTEPQQRTMLRLSLEGDADERSHGSARPSNRFWRKASPRCRSAAWLSPSAARSASKRWSG